MAYNKRNTLLVLFGLAVISIIVEYIRLENRSFRKVFYTIFGVMLRKHEFYTFSGASFLLTSSIVCVAFFPADIAFLSMSFLSIGDTFAALVGMTFGKRKFNFTKKSLEGAIACFISTFFYALFFINPVISFFGALGATLAELINLPVDDNVRIPIFSGLVMIIVYILLPEGYINSSNIFNLIF